MKFEGSIEHAQRHAEGYLMIFRRSQETMDGISAGDAARVQELLSAYPGGALPEEGQLKDSLQFRQMQACMVLGYFLHHGYLLQLPASALYDIFENRTLDIMRAKDMDQIRSAVLSTALALCSLVRERQTLHSNTVLRRADEYVENHLTERFSEQDVADSVGFSLNYLNTLFRRELHCTLHRFILEKRLRLAQTLLSSTELPIAGIAADLGFSSSSHFGAVFKEYTGYTPLQFRRRSRNSTVPSEPSVS